MLKWHINKNQRQEKKYSFTQHSVKDYCMFCPFTTNPTKNHKYFTLLPTIHAMIFYVFMCLGLVQLQLPVWHGIIVASQLPLSRLFSLKWLTNNIKSLQADFHSVVTWMKTSRPSSLQTFWHRCNNINNVSVLLKCSEPASMRNTMTKPKQLNGIQPSFIWEVTPVLFLLCHVKISSMKKAYGCLEVVKKQTNNNTL